MPYRMTDDSVTLCAPGHPENVGKSVTPRGEEMRQCHGTEPGRYDAGEPGHPERKDGKSTARDVSSVRPVDPVSDKMANLR